MTGLDLESFLLLLRADLSAWVVLGLASVGLVLLVWSCWGSRRALRKCLVVSLAAHLGLVLYGSTIPAVRSAVGGNPADAAQRSHIRQIRVAPLVEASGPQGRDATGGARHSAAVAGSGRSRPPVAALELAAAPLRLADSALRVARPEVAEQSSPEPEPKSAPLVPVGTATPRAPRSLPEPVTDGPRAESPSSSGGAPPAPPVPLPPNLAEVDRAASSAPPPAGEPRQSSRTSAGAIEQALGTRDRSLRSDTRLRPGRSTEEDDPEGPRSASLAAARRPDPGSGGTRTGGESGIGTLEGRPDAGSRAPPLAVSDGSIALERATPKARSATDGGSGLAALDVRPAVRTLAEIPKVYQPRLDPDRPNRAQRGGASSASELAVERALDWLARHQDPDGRWNAAIARYEDGSPVKGDNDFTVHCPTGETCFGECAYWEADTALTGLALLTYLGAGYTHTQGRYNETVSKGFSFLKREQKPDGDLRGRSQVVGMYCHSMATLALCESYALTGDPELRDAAVRAIAFMVRARARDGLAWRYAPGAPVGDTSILGWVVMGLKSAKEVGIPIPDEVPVRRGTLAWLDKVATGQAKGLARYQPWDRVTPTMTAEAWVCRQFLGVGGPGRASTEAAAFLLLNESDRGPTNVYYWYYATLALYQHGGEPWSRWNAMIRDRIVRLQRASGHQTGSWDPDESLYGTKGGRIYCTTLAALTLEVYYRYLRLYDEPKIPLETNATPVSRTQRRE